MIVSDVEQIILMILSKSLKIKVKKIVEEKIRTQSQVEAIVRSKQKTQKVSYVRNWQFEKWNFCRNYLAVKKIFQ